MTDRPVLASGFIAIARVFQAWRIWFCLTLLFAVLGAAFVLPVYGDLRDALDRLPGARGEFGAMLLDEVERLHDGVRPSIDAWGLIALGLWIFLAGGAATIGGVVDRRERVRPRAIRVSDFFAQSGRYVFASLRTWLVFVVSVLLWHWIWIDIALPILEKRFVHGGDERALFRYDVLREVIFGIGVWKLWVLRRLALTHLVAYERRSAIRAWFSATLFLFFHPIRCLLGFGVVTLIGVGGLAACSFVLKFAGDRLWAGAIAGLLAVATYQLALLAAYAVARLLIDTRRDIEVVHLKDPLMLESAA
ncbi:MAG: hypothetical protein H6832_13050 [Planctomycetes bacterium]|nr:hypothetical protein [Planctomycetota bacterium]